MILKKPARVQKTFTHVQWAGNNYSAKILPKKCFIILCGSFCFGHRNNLDTLPVRATTRTGYMMTSPKFSTWHPNQGTRSRVTFQLFATPRIDVFPQYLQAAPLNDEEAHECEKKKRQPMRLACSLEVKKLKRSAQRST